MRSPSSRIPPGLPYALRFLVARLAPVTAVVIVLRVGQAQGIIHIPAVWLAISAVLSITLLVAVRVVYSKYDLQRRAARLGAVLPPSWEGKSIGNIDLLQYGIERWKNGYIGDGFWEKCEELGGIHSVTLFGELMYVTTDANIIKAMLATQFEEFVKGDRFGETMNDVLGEGVFNADGDLWKFHRTMTRPYFTKDRISHFDMFDRHADLAIRKMKERFRDGRALDFQELVSRFTLDSATEFLFGNCVHSLMNDLPYAYNDRRSPQIAQTASSASTTFSQAFTGVQEALAVRLRIGWSWIFAEMFKDTTRKHMEVVSAYVQPIIEEALRKKRSAIGKDEKVTEDEETLLDHLVKKTEDPTILHDETLNIMIAGRDTTAATLTLAVYLLCLYPEAFNKLRAEIMEKIGPKQMPGFDDIRNMKYLRAVINETLRLYPIVPFNVRVPTHDTTVPNPDPSQPPIFVPADINLAYSVFMMHRRKDYWGPDAAYFDPERFLDERLNKYFTGNPFIFLPFNAGPRICLGQQFAYNEMSFFLIRLLQHFSHMELDLDAQPPEARPPPEWANDEGHRGKEKISPKVHLTLYVQGGLWVKMTEADRDD
ncbi:cytochrome P450 [Dichomitus squalens]|uniref:Cytochrome P450 n=1 Tax=Dichomitus squalens TaxID=114155 RepID=A0A4Q9Q928_9APHY|nr:cytochrome P450 [Dichomitus squalens]TBU64107.1 cytochrome P450 [Dichomitus squalens]